MLSVKAFTLVTAFCLGWALYATLAFGRAAHLVAALAGMTLAGALLDLSDRSAFAVTDVFVLALVTFVSIGVVRRLWINAIYTHWNGRGRTLSAQLAGWEPFFAWHPVHVGGSWIWLQLVERRRATNWHPGDSWVYRAIES